MTHIIFGQKNLIMMPTFLNIAFQNALFPTGLFCKKQLSLRCNIIFYFERIDCIYYFSMCICYGGNDQQPFASLQRSLNLGHLSFGKRKISFQNPFNYMRCGTTFSSSFPLPFNTNCFYKIHHNNDLLQHVTCVMSQQTKDKRKYGAASFVVCQTSFQSSLESYPVYHPHHK